MEMWDSCEKWHQLGVDFWDQQQYIRAEKFFKQALEIAESSNNLSRIIREKYYLAEMQRMLGKYQSALSWYAELIQVTYDPKSNQQLTKTDYWYIKGGFIKFIEVAMALPDTKIANLEQVLNQGRDWTASIGKQEWSSGFHLQKGYLLRTRGHHEEALEELEAALAMARRHTGLDYSLGTYIFEVGYHLRAYLNRSEEANRYHQEVVDGDEFHNYDKHRAWRELAYIFLEKKDFLRAEEAAQRALDLAQDMENPSTFCLTYDLLGEIYWSQNHIQRVIETKIQSWRYARQWTNSRQLYRTYWHFFEIRYFQARQNHCRYIPKAQRWLKWASPLAERLDRQEGKNKRQQSIQKWRAKCEQMLNEN